MFPLFDGAAVEAEPVFFLTVISKGQRANLTEDQKRKVKQVAKAEKSKRGPK